MLLVVFLYKRPTIANALDGQTFRLVQLYTLISLLTADTFLQLSYMGRSCYVIPNILIKLYSKQATRLDLSFNCLRTLAGFENFTSLQELILDNNLLEDDVIFPHSLTLTAISLNKNKV